MRLARWLLFAAFALSGPLAARAEAPVAPGSTLTLQAALGHGRSHQPTLRSARANTELERGRSDATRAPLLPQVTGTASYQRTTANIPFRPGFNSATANHTTSNQSFNFYNFGVTGSQLLYDFGLSYQAFQAGKERVRSVAASERTSALSVDYNVRSAFFAARAKQASVGVAEETLHNQERHAAQVEAFVEVGARPAIDLAQTRTDVANARVTFIRAKNDYDLARAQLNQAMGVEGTLDYQIAEETLAPVDLEDAPLEALLRAAIAGRPDLQSLALLYRAQELSLRAARGGYGPTLSATGSLTDVGTKFDNLVWNWNVGLSVNFPFLQGWLTHANVRQAKANRESVQAQLDAMRLQVRLDLTRGQLAVQSARATLGASGDALENARARLRLAEGRYEAGVGNIIELGDAQIALTNAEFQRVQAEYDLANARAQLLSALGRED